MEKYKSGEERRGSGVVKEGNELEREKRKIEAGKWGVKDREAGGYERRR